MTSSSQGLSSLEDIKIHIQTTQSNPNIGRITSTPLHDGPRVRRIATLVEILNEHTGETHHYELKIEIYKSVSGFWYRDDDASHSVTTGQGQLELLQALVNGVLEDQFTHEDGDYRLVDEATYSSAEQISRAIEQVPFSDQLNVIEQIIIQFANDATATSNLSEESESIVHNVSVALRMLEYQQVFNRLQALVETNSNSEHTIQNLLADNPWLFGSEYSELLPRRVWSRDEQLDFMLRRTVDGYLEIIEIKTPNVTPLLRYDQSHDSYYPSQQLSRVIGQTLNYIDQVERRRDSIVAQDREDPLKIRGIILIGRDGDEGHQEALRSLNAHLHRVEILTFDQLLRIGQRVLNVFEATPGEVTQDGQSVGEGELSADDEDEIPF